MGCGASSGAAAAGGGGDAAVDRGRTNARASSAKHKARRKIPHPDELHAAITLGDHDLCKKLLDAGAHVEAKLAPQKAGGGGGTKGLFRKKKFSAEDELKLKAIWTSLDADGSGALDKKELAAVFKQMGKPVTDKVRARSLCCTMADLEIARSVFVSEPPCSDARPLHSAEARPLIPDDGQGPLRRHRVQRVPRVVEEAGMLRCSNSEQ